MLLRQAGAVVPIRSCSRWGLPCHPCCQGRGALLPPRFALARGLPHGACAGGLFSVALSLGSPPPDVIRHRIPVEPGLSSATCGGSGRPAVWRGRDVRFLVGKQARFHTEDTEKAKPRKTTEKKYSASRAAHLNASSAALRGFSVSSVWNLTYPRTSRRTACRRTSVPASASPVTASGRQ
jgi:hypothetical protein